MYVLNNLNKTVREYPLAAADDLIKFWRSKVKVIAVVEVVKTSTMMLGHRSPSSG